MTQVLLLFTAKLVLSLLTSFKRDKILRHTTCLCVYKQKIRQTNISTQLKDYHPWEEVVRKVSLFTKTLNEFVLTLLKHEAFCLTLSVFMHRNS